jgi:catalase
MVRSAYELRAEDDDFGQAGTLVRDVWNDEQRAEFVETVSGHLLGGVTGDVLEKAFEYWKNVDATTGKLIEELVRAGNGGDNPGTQAGLAKAEASSPIVETNTNAGSPPV